jgi:hypothetical protein
MTDIEPLPERVDRIEHKLDALSKSVDVLSASVDRRFEDVNRRFDDVDKRFKDVDKRFDEVSEHFVEQRQYTEFAFEKLRGEMQTGFRFIEGRLDRFEKKFDDFVASQVGRPFPRQRSRRSTKKR